MNLFTRRLFCARVALTLGLLAAPLSSANAADAAPAPPSGTIIYALGTSLFFQALDGSEAREEKLDLPAGAPIEYLSGARDGKTLAFGTGKSVYFYDVAAKTLAPLVPELGGKFVYPAISPDGASVSVRPYRADATLTILNRDGTARDLGASTKGITTSRWTGDGQTIYFATGPNFYRIAATEGDTDAEAELFVRGNYIEKFDINARGLIIAPIPGEAGVTPFLLDEAGRKTALDCEFSDFYAPAWNGDGTAIVFSRRARYGGEDNAQGIYIWENVEGKTQPRKISDAQLNANSGFVWR